MWQSVRNVLLTNQNFSENLTIFENQNWFVLKKLKIFGWVTLNNMPMKRCKVPMVKFNEGDRVEYNGWLGSIRELDEDRIIIETEDGVINFDDDEDAKIDPEFRFLSLRGIYEHVRTPNDLTFDRTVTLTLSDWRMETKWGRFWNFSESTGYWKFCPRWWITNWKNCPNWKWRLWNILGRIWKSKRNTRTEIRLVLWRVEIAKCSMVLEYKSLRRVTNPKLFFGIFPGSTTKLSRAENDGVRPTFPKDRPIRSQGPLTQCW